MDIITSAQAAEILAVSQRTIQRMVADDKLTPTHRLPAGFLFHRADVEALRETSEAQSA